MEAEERAVEDEHARDEDAERCDEDRALEERNGAKRMIWSVMAEMEPKACAWRGEPASRASEMSDTTSMVEEMELRAVELLHDGDAGKGGDEVRAHGGVG